MTISYVIHTLENLRFSSPLQILSFPSSFIFLLRSFIYLHWANQLQVCYLWAIAEVSSFPYLHFLGFKSSACRLSTSHSLLCFKPLLSVVCTSKIYRNYILDTINRGHRFRVTWIFSLVVHFENPVYPSPVLIRIDSLLGKDSLGARSLDNCRK